MLATASCRDGWASEVSISISQSAIEDRRWAGIIRCATSSLAWSVYKVYLLRCLLVSGIRRHFTYAGHILRMRASAQQPSIWFHASWFSCTAKMASREHWAILTCQPAADVTREFRRYKFQCHIYHSRLIFQMEAANYIELVEPSIRKFITPSKKRFW